MNKENLPKGWNESDNDDDEIFNADDENEDSPWEHLNNSDENNNSSENESDNQISDKPKQSKSGSVQSRTVNRNFSAVPILMSVIIVLIIAIIGLSVIFLKNKNNNNIKSNSNKIEEASTEHTESETTVTAMLSTTYTDSTTETSKETTATTIWTEPIKTQETKEVVLSYKDSYKKIVNDEIKRLRENDGSNFSIEYTLFDMDSDGIPELLMRSGSCEADSLISIYTYKNNKYSQIGNNIGGSHTHFAFDYIANQIVLCNAHMGNITLSWYDIDGNGNLRFLIDTSSSGNDYNTYAVFMTSYNVSNYPYAYYSNNSNNTSVYYSFDNYEVYADAEYSGINFSFIDNYESLKAKVDNVTANAVPATKAYIPPKETYAFSGVVNTESSDLNVRERPSTDSSVIGTLPKGTSISVYYIDGYSDWYKIYCSQYNLGGYVSAQYVKEVKGMTYDTSAAGSDFSFFNSPYSRKVITESDPLNLRSAPSTSAEIIIKIPKDSPVTLYGSNGGGLIGGLDNNSGWSYISYTENGITYYGYASSEFIGLP